MNIRFGVISYSDVTTLDWSEPNHFERLESSDTVSHRNHLGCNDTALFFKRTITFGITRSPFDVSRFAFQLGIDLSQSSKLQQI